MSGRPLLDRGRRRTRVLRRGLLRVVGGPGAGRELLMSKERVTVGSSMASDLTIEDAELAGNHFEVVASERGFLLRELDSATGIRCGGLRVREVWLDSGNEIEAGASRVRFEALEGTFEVEQSVAESFHTMTGRGTRMREIFAVLEKVAPTDLTVLLRGETGTGKELAARAIHRASRRATRPLVVQDCSAIPRELIESTLFGHERGAFTGATDRHRGSFEVADGGTLFLDEIGELDLSLQPKLLRVLENRELLRVGAERPMSVDVRVVAATNRDLRQMVNEGTFREDLYYRLSVVQVDLPPLRERKEDIPLLVASFLDAVSRRRWPGEERRVTVRPDALERLCEYPWPGNIRELKNTLERAATLAEGTELGVTELLPLSQKTPAVPLPGGTAEALLELGLSFKDAKKRVVAEFEAAYLKALLETHAGNVSRAARASGLTRFHLRELAKRYGLRDVD